MRNSGVATAERWSFLTGGGELGQLLRSKDWTASQAGAPDTWPEAIKTALSLCLGSPAPMIVWIGDALSRLVPLYNDAYRPLLGDAHPAALGDVENPSWARLAPDLSETLAPSTPDRHDAPPMVAIGEQTPREISATHAHGPIRDGEGTLVGVLTVVTEHGEDALRESGEQLRLATEAAEIGLWDVDGETDALFWPPRVKAMFGISPDIDVTMADHFYRGVHPDDLARVGEAFAAARDPARRAFYDVEYRTIGREDGIERWVSAKGRGIFDERGRCVRVIGAAMDISARKQAAERLAASEVALRRSEDRYRALFEAIDAGFCVLELIFDGDGRAVDYLFLETNPAFARQAGFTDAVGRRVRDILPDLEASWIELYGEIARTGQPRRVEQGSLALGRWWDVRAFRVGEPHQHHVAVLFTDVTLRHRAELAMREANETLERRVAEALAERKLLADIVDGTDAFVQVADPAFDWLAINKAAAAEFARIFGVRAPRAGDNMLALLADKPLHRAAVEAVWSRALAGEEFVEVAEFGDAGIERRWYEMRFRPLRDASGATIGAYQFVYDVSERLNEQQRLRETETALAQAQKMETVGQLTGGIAHDFNNVLQGVAHSLELIRKKPTEAARVQRWAEAGLRITGRGAKLTSQLLAFSRAQRLEAKPLVVEALIENMVDLVHRTIGPGVRVVLDLDAERTPVLTDATQLEMAVLNLAINARDAMPDGGHLTISTRPKQLVDDPELAPGSYVALSLRDTGTGMPPAVMQRAFDPFFTTKEVGKGTGLGLSQVYGVARQAGGAARIESSVGAGTTVYLLLPRTERPIVPDEVALAHVTDAGARQATVLVVDDDADVRELLVDSLETLGFSLIVAEDGPRALAALARTKPDLILLDFAMPGMNGAEVFRLARAIHPTLPIVFASGYSDTAAIEQVAGPEVPVLRKPFRSEDLLAVLAGALAQAR